MREPIAVGRVKRPTLADVARIAGVSVQTASHVISESPHARISEPTRARIKEAAQKLGYRPNRLAQAMKYGRTQVVAVWVPIERLHTSIHLFLEAYNVIAREASQDLVLIGLESDLAYGRVWRSPLNWPVDGIIALDCGYAARRFFDETGDSSTPFCIVGNEVIPNSDRVSWQVQEAMTELVAESAATPAANIWHLSLDWILDGYPLERRRTGYRNALEAAGQPVREIGVKDEGAEAVGQALDAAKEKWGIPTHVFAANHILANNAAWWASGPACIKEKVDIWGYGEACTSCPAPIRTSSLNIPIAEVARQSWDLLQSRIEDPSQGPRAIDLPMIVERHP